MKAREVEESQTSAVSTKAREESVSRKMHGVESTTVTIVLVS